MREPAPEKSSSLGATSVITGAAWDDGTSVSNLCGGSCSDSLRSPSGLYLVGSGVKRGVKKNINLRVVKANLEVYR